MKTLKIYYIDENYIKYLRKFDKIVPYNKTHTRPYIGVVYEYNGINYTNYLNRHKYKLLSKVKQFRLRYDNGYLSSRLRKRCCNFKLLEEKCKEYENLILETV